MSSTTTSMTKETQAPAKVLLSSSARQKLLAFASLLGLMIFFSFASPAFMQTDNMVGILQATAVNGVLAIPNIASYNVSKGGINQLTRVMALSLADKGIRVNAVAPGTIATELAAKAVLTSEEARQKIMSRTPMGRLGEPSEIAEVVAWLASDAASYITGEIVTVDGGRMTLNYTMPVAGA